MPTQGENLVQEPIGPDEDAQLRASPTAARSGAGPLITDHISNSKFVGPNARSSPSGNQPGFSEQEMDQQEQRDNAQLSERRSELEALQRQNSIRLK